MPKIKRTVTVNGKKKMIYANTEQEYAEKLLSVYGVSEEAKTKTVFGEYALKWFNIYSEPNIEAVTAETYKRALKNNILPILKDCYLEDITVDDLQRVFNNMGNVTAATKRKPQCVLNQIFEAALEDGLIMRNPMTSKKLSIRGKESKSTVPYTVEEMQYIVSHIKDVKKPQDRLFLSLMSFHPFRLEEALGIKRKDINAESHTVKICRAVTHPKRNAPEIKSTKTKSSNRELVLSNIIFDMIEDIQADDFLIGGKEPLSYTQVKRMCDRISKDIDFAEGITPRRFRTTVLSDIYDTTKDVKLTQSAAGHTTPAMTLKYYVKGREDISTATDKITELYGVKIH